MTKRVVVLSLSLLFIASLSVFGTEKHRDEKMLERLEKIEKVAYPDESIISKYLAIPEQKIFFPATGDTAGYTYYDYQHNSSQRRQIANDYAGNLHLDWMDLVAADMESNRYIDYNFLSAGGSWLAPGGLYITLPAARGGYCGLDIYPDSREVLAYHLGLWRTTLSVERTTAGLGDFLDYDVPDSVAGKFEKLIWPHVATAKAATSPVGTPYIHMTNFSLDHYAGYLRCYQDTGSTPDLICESPGMAEVTIPVWTTLTPNRLPYLFTGGDNIIPYSAAPVVTSPSDSGKVAIAWCDQTGAISQESDIFYVESTNNGQDWIDAGNMGSPTQITDYASEDYIQLAYPDIAAVYDYNDELHIIWTTFTSGSPNNVTLWQWSPSTGIRIVNSALEPSTVNTGTWNLLIAKFNLGVGCNPSDTAYNYLYVNYTRFANEDTSAGGFANGDIYLKVSSSGGLTWGPEINLTNTNTNGCSPGNCLSEHWSSIAERVDSFLYVEYIEDKDAGGIPWEEGTFTQNAVRYLKYPRPLVPAIVTMVFNPNQMIEPLNWAQNNGSTAKNMQFDNYGTATLYVQISGPSWITSIAPSSFNIAEGGPTQTVNLTLSGIGLQDTLLVDSLLIASNKDTTGEVYSDTQWVKIHFVVSNEFFTGERDTVDNGALATIVSNVGNLGNHDSNSGLYYNGFNYLYDCSPVILTNIDGYGWKGSSWIHDRRDFLPLSPLQVTTDECSGDIVITTISKFAPINPSIPTTTYHWYWWWYGIEEKNILFTEPAELRKTIVKTVKLTKNPPPPWWCHIEPEPPNLPSVYFGLAADWDVPTQGLFKNRGGYDDTLNLIWLYADTAGLENYYGGFLFFYAAKNGDTSWAPIGAHVLDNVTQLWPSLYGWDDDSLYKYMSTPGYSIESDSAQDKNILISAIYLDNPDTTIEVTVKYALIVTDQGLSDIYSIANLIKQNSCGNISDTLTYTAYSPVDIIVTDPLEDSIGVDFNTIPGATYDTTQDINNDGDLDDRVVIPNPVVGEYMVRVVGEPDGDNGNYTLAVKLDGNEEMPLVLNATVPEPGEVDTVFYTTDEYLRGDPNRDGSPSVSDVIFLINYLFKGGEVPEPLFLGDVNCDESVSVADVVYMVNYLFKGGNAPCS